MVRLNTMEETAYNLLLPLFHFLLVSPQFYTSAQDEDRTLPNCVIYPTMIKC